MSKVVVKKQEEPEEDVYVPSREEEAIIEQGIVALERGEWTDWDELLEQRRGDQQ